MTTAPFQTGAAMSKPRAPHENYVQGHHWRNMRDESEAAKLGMWLFLSTEVLLFAGFFCAYAVFRMMHPENWHEASSYYLNWKIGCANTVVLLLSSYTMVMAIRAAQQNKQALIQINLAITWACAAFFLIVKLGWEYWPKIQKGELPGGLFNYAGAQGPHDQIFLSVYWVATATHGIHVAVGMIVIAWAMWRTHKGHYGPRHYTSLENIGLYWHIVDIIWIFLFPLLYLV